MLSRMLGLVRDILMAAFFGTSLYMSAFVVAFTIPNLFRRLFGEGALSSSFVPVFVETREREGKSVAWNLLGRVVSLAGVFFFAIVVVGVLIASLGAHISWVGERWQMIFSLLRIMFPYMMFICLAALFMAVLNSYQRFAVPAFIPCLLNIIWIVALLVLCPLVGSDLQSRIYLVAWAVLLGGIVQFGAQLPSLIGLGYRPGIDLKWHDKHVRKMLLLMGPAAFGMALTQVNVLADRLLAMGVGAWAPSALYYSERLIYLPIGLFATALGTVLLPAFSEHVARKDFRKMRETLDRFMRQMLFIMIPAAFGIFVLAEPIIQMLFEWGNFSADSSHLTAVALCCYAPGLIFFSMAKIIVPGFYSLQDMRTPLRVGFRAVALNIALDILFILVLPLEFKHGGIALATVIAAIFNVVTLTLILQRRIGRLNWRAIAISALRGTLAASGMAGATLFIYSSLISSPIFAGKIAQIGAALTTISGGIAIYVGLACLMRAPEPAGILAALQSRSSDSNGDV